LADVKAIHAHARDLNLAIRQSERVKLLPTFALPEAASRLTVMGQSS